MSTDCMHSSSERPLQPGSEDFYISKRQVDSIMSQADSPIEHTPSDTIEYVDTSVFTAPSAPPITIVVVSTVTPTGTGETPVVVTVIRTFTPPEPPHLPSDTGSITSSIASELEPASLITYSRASTTQGPATASGVPPIDEQTWSPQDDSDGTARTAGIIAGIAIGLLAIGFVGGWFFRRRRNRTRGKPQSKKNDDEIGTDGDGDRDRDGGIPELDTMELPQELQESRSVQTREQDHTRYPDYALDRAHELKADSATAELLNGQGEHTPLVAKHDPQRPAAGIMETSNNTLSSNVEAQRRREMEWLEMEEERIRKRRELLAAQGGTNN